MSRTPNAIAAPVEAPAAPQLDIAIDLNGLTFGDIKLFKAMKDGAAVNQDVLLGVLDRCVVGGIDHLPFTALPQIAEALNAALSASSNPKN